MSGPLPDDPAPAEKLVPDPACKSCRGTGRYVVGYSGRDDDGNAPIWEDCDCFIPAAGVPARLQGEPEEDYRERIAGVKGPDHG